MWVVHVKYWFYGKLLERQKVLELGWSLLGAEGIFGELY